MRCKRGRRSLQSARNIAHTDLETVDATVDDHRLRFSGVLVILNVRLHGGAPLEQTMTVTVVGPCGTFVRVVFPHPQVSTPVRAAMTTAKEQIFRGLPLSGYQAEDENFVRRRCVVRRQATENVQLVLIFHL